jgi:hypothetical protein
MEPIGEKEEALDCFVLFGKIDLFSSHARPFFRCKYCAQQKETLGQQAFDADRIPYIECSPDGQNSQATTLCQENKITGFPTWEIGGKFYAGERSLVDLATLVRMAQATTTTKSKAPPKVMASSSPRAVDLSNRLATLQAKLFGSYWDPHTFEQRERLG